MMNDEPFEDTALQRAIESDRELVDSIDDVICEALGGSRDAGHDILEMLFERFDITRKVAA